MSPDKELLVSYEQNGNNSDSTSRLVDLTSINCPPGTVPIPRVDKKEPQNTRILDSAGQNFHLVSRKASKFFGLEDGLRISGKVFYGASARISLYNPKLHSQNQFSSAMIAIENGDDQIKVGLTVNPREYGDTRTRFFTSWKLKNGGCFNVKCPGFVLVSESVPLNYVFPVTFTYDKESVDMYVDVTQNLNTGNWWVMLGQAKVGYRPESIFISLRDGGANVVRFGGEIFTPAGEKSHEMGSGAFENGHYDRTCYSANMFLVDDRHFPTPPSLYRNVQPVETRYFFEVDHSNKNNDFGYSFLFGGERGKDKSLTCVYPS